jgi:hypothetical protein
MAKFRSPVAFQSACVLTLVHRREQGTYVSTMDSVEMLFKFIAPLVEEGADDDDMDEEVSLTHLFSAFELLHRPLSLLGSLATPGK